jgi:hypothetical protein
VVDHTTLHLPGAATVGEFTFHPPHIPGQVWFVTTHPLAPEAALELITNHVVVMCGFFNGTSHNLIFNDSSNSRLSRRWDRCSPNDHGWCGSRGELVLERVSTHGLWSWRRRSRDGGGITEELFTHDILPSSHSRASRGFILGLNLETGLFDEVPSVHITIQTYFFSDCCQPSIPPRSHRPRKTRAELGTRDHCN